MATGVNTGVGSDQNVQFLTTAASFVVNSLKRREDICGREVADLSGSNDLVAVHGAEWKVAEMTREVEKLYAAKKQFSSELKLLDKKLQELNKTLSTKKSEIIAVSIASADAAGGDSDTDELVEAATTAKADAVVTEALGTASVAEAEEVGSAPGSTAPAVSESGPIANESVCESGTPRLVFYCDGLKEGDTLFMRGDGPDMSWEKGIPCQHHYEGHYYVDLLQGAPEQFAFKLLINDAVWSQGENFTFSKTAYEEEKAFAFSPVFESAV